jgi:hypothetical protein
MAGHEPSLHFIQGYYRQNSHSKAPDIMIVRHVLEHQGHPHEFFEGILPDPVGNKPIEIYVEVPAWEWIVRNNQISAFHYEHCSYFTKFSIKALLGLHHYTASKISYTFSDEYLQYFGANSDAPDHSEFPESKEAAWQSLLEESLAFADRIPRILTGLRTHLDSLLDQAVLWGAAGKGTGLLNFLEIDYHQLPYVVDSNPRRHNTYIPGTGQQVIDPEFLTKLHPKYILLTNSNYQREIESRVASLGLQAEFVPIDQIINSF